MRKLLKKSVAVMLSVIMLISTMAVSGIVTAGAAIDDIISGYEFAYGDFTCRYDSYYGGIAITDAADTLVEAVIPDTIEGIEVVAIRYEAFADNTNLKSVTLPNTLTDIDSSVFESCTALESITIPESVKSIDYAAFRHCTSLKEINVSNNIIAFGGYVFENTAWYNSQPDGVVYLGSAAYKYKGTLPENASITIKDGTKSIVANAFKETQYIDGGYCDITQNDNLVEVILPESLVIIDDNSFNDCKGLTAISFPSNIETIDYQAFYGCTSLQTIEWPANLKKIGGYAFCGCNALESVSLPDGLESIGYGAFKLCEGLKTVEMTDSVTTMEAEVFSNCHALESVRLSDSLTYVHGYTFELCYELREVNIPKNAEIIRVKAFDRCISLEEIVLPEGLKTLEKYVFIQCSSLSKINIPESVEEIGVKAFAYTPWYDAIPDGIIYFNNVLYALKGTVEEEIINIKDGTTYITENAFWGNDYVKKITMPDSVTFMGDYVFEGCSALEEIKLSQNITEIPYYSLAYCTNLKSVVIPEGVTLLDYSCLYGCESLTTLYLPKSLSEVHYFLSEYSSPLTDIYYAGSEEELNSINYHTSLMDTLKNMESITFHYNYVYEEPTEDKVEKVENITATPYTTSVELEWDAVENAEKYWIYKLQSDGTYTCVKATTETNYTIARLSEDTEYSYKITFRVKDEQASSLDKADVITVKTLKTPSVETITGVGNTFDGYLSWEPVEGATKYWIYKSRSENGPFYCCDSTTDTEYVARRLKAGTDYYFKVIALTYENGKQLISKVEDAPVAKITTASSESIQVAVDNITSTTATLSWPAYETAEKYWILYSNTTNDVEKTEEWTTLVSTTDTEYTLKNLKPNTTYYFAVTVKYPDATAGSVVSYYIPEDTKTLYSDDNFLTFTSVDDTTVTVAWPEDIEYDKYWVYVFDSEGNQLKMSSTTTNSITLNGIDYKNCTFALSVKDADLTARFITPALGFAYNN